MLLLGPEPAATTPAPDPAPLLEELATLRLENAALRVQNAALQERIRGLEARLGQTSSNSSRPPSSDPLHGARQRSVVPSGRKRPARPPRGLPCPTAGRASGRGGDRRAKGVPALRAAVSRTRRPSSCARLAASDRGAPAAGGAGDGVPDGRAPLPGLREAHPSGAAAQGATAAVRVAAHRRGQGS